MIGRDDGITRHIATSGRTTFAQGRAVGFIGAAIDVTAQRRTEAAIRASEAQFRSFAAHSSNLIWIGDPAAGTIIYRSAAYERIWGVPCREAPTALAEWMKDVHPDDRHQVEHALATVKAGEVAQFEYRIIRPADGTIRWLRDTSFPIPDENGAVTRIGGITEDLTQEDVRQVYVVSARAAEARRLAGLVRERSAIGPGRSRAPPPFSTSPRCSRPAACSSISARRARRASRYPASSRRGRLRCRPSCSTHPAPTSAAAVAAMKAGAIDYLTVTDESIAARRRSRTRWRNVTARVRPTTRDENAGARIARLTPREREVLVGLVERRDQQVDRPEISASVLVRWNYTAPRS